MTAAKENRPAEVVDTGRSSKGNLNDDPARQRNASEPLKISALADDITGYANAADIYWNLGWRGVLALDAGTKVPPPIGFTGYDGIDPSYPDVCEWKNSKPDGNTAIRLSGSEIGIDVDCHSGKAGAATLAEAERRWGKLPSAPTSTSRRDGSGIRLFRVPPGTKLDTVIKFEIDGRKLGDIEIIQHHHRYVVAWPSCHPDTGEQYRWERDGKIIDPPAPDDLPELPAAWIDGLRVEDSRNGAEIGSQIPADVWKYLTEGEMSGRVAAKLSEAIADLSTGSRHDNTREHCLTLLRYGKCGDPGTMNAVNVLGEAFVKAVGADRKGGAEEAKAEYVRYFTNAGAARLLATPNTTEYIPPPDEPPQWPPCDSEGSTDAEPPEGEPGDTALDTFTHSGHLGMADQFAQFAGGKLIHVFGIGWHIWDGTRWKLDEAGHTQRMLKDLLRREWMRAFAIPDTDKRRRRISEIARCESAPGMKGVLYCASFLDAFATVADDLDPDPYLVNCANGTLDLRTGELHAHNAADKITKVTRGAYHLDAAGELWPAFLKKVLPDNDIRGYLQRVCGVALLGKVIEHNMSILKGVGNNGKGTFYQALVFALGDYASMADPDLFLERKSTSHLGEMALRGLRLAVVSESGKGRALDEARMKRLTGGDLINARFHYQNPVTFSPSHLPLFVTNHLPKVSGGDPAVWRRLRVIPFDVVITEAERDNELDAKLQLEADTILAWAVDGWKAYVAKGNRLAEPVGVLAATTQYRTDSDDIQRFLDDKDWVYIPPPLPSLQAKNKATGKQLHNAYLKWANEEGGDDSVSLRAFTAALDAKGFTAPEAMRTNKGRWRPGICLTDLHAADGNDEPQRKGKW